MANNSPSRLKQGTVAGAMLFAVIGGFEGVRTVAYPDPATKGPPWTVCYGETQGVHKGDRYTLAECKDMLAKRLPDYVVPISKCVKVPLPDKRYIALVSLAWNYGAGRVCYGDPKHPERPSVVALLNAGKVNAGCQAFMRYVYAAGIRFPGLVKRRERERALCLEPIGPNNPVGAS